MFCVELVLKKLSLMLFVPGPRERTQILVYIDTTSPSPGVMFIRITKLQKKPRSKNDLFMNLSLCMYLSTTTCYPTDVGGSARRVDLHECSAYAMLGLCDGSRFRRGSTALWKMPSLLRIFVDMTSSSSQGARLSPTIIALTCTTADYIEGMHRVNKMGKAIEQPILYAVIMQCSGSEPLQKV